MNKKDITERLLALSKKPEHRSKAARLRDVIDDIEAAMAKGIPRKVIVSELASTGLDMPLATFDSIVLRHRKKRAISTVPTKRNHHTQSAPDKGALTEADETETPNTSSPAMLNDIINSTPDLAEYARIVRESKRKKNS